MQNELPFKGDKGFESVGEYIARSNYVERLLDRAANPALPIPEDEEGQLNWVNNNL